MTHDSCSEFHPLRDNSAPVCVCGRPVVVTAHSNRLATTLHVLTLVLLGTLVVGGAMIYREVRRDIDTMKQPRYWVNALLPDPANVPPQVVNVAAATIGGAFDQWFLGSLNGTIAGFLQRLATSDFASVGAEVQQLSTTLLAAIASSCPPSSSVTCPTGGEYLQCANGNVVYCSYQGEVVSCGSPCQTSGLYEPVSVVQSVAGTIATLTPVARSNSSSTDPAFSSGPFALSVLLQWLRAQTTTEPWVAAAEACVTLADNVIANDWSGAYKDFSGSAEGWDANQQVQSTARTVRHVCLAVANMTV